MPDEFPRRMQLGDLERREEEWTSKTVLVGRGVCPWCGWGPMATEAGARGYCPVPSCAGPILAVL